MEKKEISKQLKELREEVEGWDKKKILLFGGLSLAALAFILSRRSKAKMEKFVMRWLDTIHNCSPPINYVHFKPQYIGESYLLALIHHYSEGDPSYAGEDRYGLTGFPMNYSWGFRQETKLRVTVDRLMDPCQNIKFCARFLAWLQDTYSSKDILRRRGFLPSDKEIVVGEIKKARAFWLDYYDKGTVNMTKEGYIADRRFVNKISKLAMEYQKLIYGFEN